MNRSNSKLVLITGGAGFIGLNTALKLVQQGHSVRILDNLSGQIHGSGASWPLALTHGCELILGDVRKYEDWLAAIKDIDIIFHFAAETGTGQSMYQVTNYIDVNIKGTALLLDILVNEKHKVKKIILSSSRAVYGEGAYIKEDGNIVFPESRSAQNIKNGDYQPRADGYSGKITSTPTPEDSKLNPISIYAQTKLSQEQLMNIVCSSLNISLVMLRYQNVYGPGQSLKNPYTGIISIFMNLARDNSPINVFEDGLAARDFVFIDDAVRANLMALNDNLYGRHIINIGSGKLTTILEVVRAIESYTGNNVKYNISGEFRCGDIRSCYADLTFAKKILGYEPKVSFEAGIKKFCDWAFAQPNYKISYESSLEELKQKKLMA